MDMVVEAEARMIGLEHMWGQAIERGDTQLAEFFGPKIIAAQEMSAGNSCNSHVGAAIKLRDAASILEAKEIEQFGPIVDELRSFAKSIHVNRRELPDLKRLRKIALALTGWGHTDLDAAAEAILDAWRFLSRPRDVVDIERA